MFLGFRGKKNLFRFSREKHIFFRSGEKAYGFQFLTKFICFSGFDQKTYVSGFEGNFICFSVLEGKTYFIGSRAKNMCFLGSGQKPCAFDPYKH